MKRIANYLIALAVAAFTFTSCEDVPSPFGEIVKPDSGDDVIVIDPAGSGTEADPYNVTAIRERTTLLADGDVISGVYTKGYIVQIDEIDTSGTYGNSTYWISDDKDGKSGKFEVYRGVGLGGQKFNEAGATIIKEGDLVVIFGNTKNFRGNTPEYDSGSYLVELNGTKASGGGGSTETLGTKDAPLTVAQALEYIKPLADNASTDKSAYVAGKITQIKTSDANIATYKNIDYVISDGTNEITVFRGKNLDNTDFTAAGQINVGDEVVVFGKLTKYVKDGTTTPEVAQGNYIVKYTKGSGGGTSGDLGTKDAPLTVAKALEIINALENGKETADNGYVKGKVVKVLTNQTNFEKYGNLNYYISEDGSENNMIQVYSGDGLDGAKFTSINDLAAGDEVVVCGKLYKYVKSDGTVVPEINKGNYLVYFKKGSGNSGTPSTGNFEAGKYFFAYNDGGTYKVGIPVEAGKSYGYINLTNATVTDGKLTSDDANLFTFTAEGSGYTIQDASGVYYYMQGTYNSFQLSSTKPSENHVWNITINNDGSATIKNAGTGKTIQLSSYGNFSPYTDVTGALPLLVKKGGSVSGGGSGSGNTPGGGTSASSITVDMSSLGVTNGNEMGTQTLSDGTVLTFDKGNNSNAPKFYDSGKAARMYPTNTLTVKASKKIDSIHFTCSANNAEGNVTASAGTVAVSDMNITISGINNTTTTITNSHTGTGAASQLRIATIVINYAN